MVKENIQFEINRCRELVSDLAHRHVKVLIQYDHFTEALLQAYLAGEGLIHKDLYRIIEAIEFSAQKHQFQTRKDPDSTPYIIHPIGVANNLLTIGNVRDPDIIIGALLHDTVEDTNTTFEEIEEKFGSRVTGFVSEVTDNKLLPQQSRKQLQIEHAPHKSAGAAQIKLADKLYNLIDLAQSPPPGWEKARVNAYFTWGQAVVDNLPWVNKPLKKAIDEVIQRYRKDSSIDKSTDYLQ